MSGAQETAVILVGMLAATTVLINVIWAYVKYKLADHEERMLHGEIVQAATSKGYVTHYELPRAWVVK